MTHGEASGPERGPAAWKDRVMHACLQVDGATIMGSDSPPDHHQPAKGMYANVQLQDTEVAERIFASLSEGGTISMPIAKTSWAERFGMVVDRFGTPWMLNCYTPSAA